MKKKYNIFFFLMLFLFAISKTYALDSRCASLYNNIKNNELNLVFDELSYFKKTYPAIIFEEYFDIDEQNFKFLRDRNNNLIIGRIFEESLVSEIIDNKKIFKDFNIGNKLLAINGKKVKNLNNEELIVLLGPYLDLDLNEKELESLEFDILNNNNQIIKLKPNYIDFESHAVAYIDLNIKNISNIDVKKNSFEADLDFSIYWENEDIYPLGKNIMIVDKDKSEYWYCTYSPKEFEEMQIGEVFFEISNSIVQNQNLIYDDYEFNISDQYYDQGRLNKKEKNFIEINHKKKGNFTFNNDYNLKAFPFDRQILKIQITDPTRTIQNLTLNGTTNLVYTLDNYKNNGKILEWKIIDANYKYYNHLNLLNDSIYSGIEVVVEIERDFQYYIFKVIAPIVLILLVCWSVFWIHPRELESKLTITIICLLSLIAYNFVIDADLPKLSYLTIIDYIILLSYLFATVPNFLSIYSFQNWKAKKNNWVNVDKKSRVYGPFGFIICVLLIIFVNSFNNQYTSAFLGFLR